MPKPFSRRQIASNRCAKYCAVSFGLSDLLVYYDEWIFPEGCCNRELTCQTLLVSFNLITV